MLRFVPMLAAPLLVQACLGCTEIGCFGGGTLALAGELQDGTWDITTTIGDGSPVLCTFVVEEGWGDPVDGCRYTLSADALSLPIPTSDGTTITLDFHRADDGVEASATSTPAVTRNLFPNGRRCGPGCTTSNAAIELPVAITVQR